MTQCEHTFGLQALAPPLWWRRARLGLQLLMKDQQNEEAFKLLSGINPFSRPRGKEQPSHTQGYKTYTLSHFQQKPPPKKNLDYFQLTVKITSKQLQPQSRFLLIAMWMNPDVASHKRWREAVVLYLSAVQVATKYLQHSDTQDSSD